MGDNKKLLGSEGEKFTEQYLLKKNYKILEKNWRYGHLEADFIAIDTDDIVFIEVKTRKKFENYDTLISRKKEKNLLELADFYVNKIQTDLNVRFDVIILYKNNYGFSLKHYKNAFYPEF